MRRVAASLGVEAMSLYSHVSSKHDLIVAMNDTVMGGVGHSTSSSGDPLDDAIQFARELRTALLRYPNTARLFAMNMTLQDSYATQVLTARSLELLGRLGHDLQSGAYMFGLCLSFVIGAVLLEIAITNTDAPSTEIYDPSVAFDQGILRLLNRGIQATSNT